MPAHERLGTDDGYQLEDRRKPAIELDAEQAIGIGNLNAAVHFAPQDDQLLPKNRILCFEPALGLEEDRNQVQGQDKECDHLRQREAIL